MNARLMVPLRAAAVAFGAVAFCLASSGDVFAQMLEPPQRPFRGLFGGGRPADPDRSSQELTLLSTASTGFEDALSTDGAPINSPAQPRADSFVGHADSLLRYWVGTRNRNLEVSARGFMTAFPDLDVDPVAGGEGLIRATSTFRRALTVGGRYGASYQPLLSLGGFGTFTGDIGSVDLPNADEAFGLREVGSWNYEGSGDLGYRFGTRHTVSTSFTLNQRRYTSGGGLDSRTTVGGASYLWNVSRSVGLNVAYRDYSTEFVDLEEAAGREQRDQSLTGGVSYTRRLSATRTISIDGTAGPSYVSTTEQQTNLPIHYWAPGGRGSMRIDVWRRWSLGADYRRGLTVLDAVGRDAFYSDAATIRLGGYLSSRLDLNISTGIARGREQGQLETEVGRYTSYTGIVQGRFAITRNLATVVTYNYYQYHLRGVTIVDPEIPTSAERNMIRVGISWWLPLYGRYGAAPPQPAGGR